MRQNELSSLKKRRVTTFDAFAVCGQNRVQ